MGYPGQERLMGLPAGSIVQLTGLHIKYKLNIRIPINIQV